MTDTTKSVGPIYRKAAKNLRQWLNPNKGWPNRSMDDDLAHAASLLEAAGQMADAIHEVGRK